MDPKNPHEAIRIKELQKDALGLCSFFQITEISKHPINVWKKVVVIVILRKKYISGSIFFCSYYSILVLGMFEAFLEAALQLILQICIILWTGNISKVFFLIW